MADVIEQLHRYGAAAEAAVAPAAVPSRRDHRHRRPFLLAAATLVLVACTAAGVWALRADDGTQDDGPVVDTTEVPVESGWQTLDPGPLEPREGAAVVWTGEELVVWGGLPAEPDVDRDFPTGFSDGAAFSPTADRWRSMAPALMTNAGSVVGVWADGEALLWSIGGPSSGPETIAGQNGLAWNQVTDEWRRIGECVPSTPYDCAAPFDAFQAYGTATGPLEPVWTGTEVIDAAGEAAYDPATDTWRDLPPRPIEGEIQASAWIGEELLVLVANRSDSSYPAGEAVALSYSPADDAWTALPPTGVGETAVDLAWDGEQAVALDYEMRAATYDPAGGTWTPLPDLPLRSGECSPQLARMGDTVLANHCSGYALLTEDRQWAIAPPPGGDLGQLVSTEGGLISWSSSDVSGDPPGTSFQSYTAPEIPAGDLALERTIPIGTVLLDLPDDARLTSTGLDEEAGGLVTGLSFTIQLGSVGCRLTSTYAGIPSEVRIRNDASTVGAELSRIPLDGVDVDRDRALVAQWPAGATDDQAHILLEESTSDVLDIACPDLPLANALLELIHR